MSRLGLYMKLSLERTESVTIERRSVLSTSRSTDAATVAVLSTSFHIKLQQVDAGESKVVFFYSWSFFSVRVWVSYN